MCQQFQKALLWGEKLDRYRMTSSAFVRKVNKKKTYYLSQEAYCICNGNYRFVMGKIWTEGSNFYLGVISDKLGNSFSNLMRPSVKLQLPPLLECNDMNLLRGMMQELILSPIFHCLICFIMYYILPKGYVGKREITMRIKTKREDCYFFYKEQIAKVWHFSHTSCIVLSLGFWGVFN